MLVRVEEEHVSQRAVRQRGREHGNLVLGRPVVNRALVVNLETQARDHFGRGPQSTLGKTREL